jgi:hypothetical protein
MKKLIHYVPEIGEKFGNAELDPTFLAGTTGSPAPQMQEQKHGHFCPAKNAIFCSAYQPS